MIKIDEETLRHLLYLAINHGRLAEYQKFEMDKWVDDRIRKLMMEIKSDSDSFGKYEIEDITKGDGWCTVGLIFDGEYVLMREHQREFILENTNITGTITTPY